MKKQVKEWIVDKNLTTDSFDSIMIGVIYNSGHSTLDDPDIRKWIETHPGEFREMLPIKLTDDQQIVLDWLKQYREEQGENPLNTVSTLIDMYCADPAGGEVPLPSNVKEAYKKLNDEQEFQVLAAFAEGGMANE